MKVNVRIDASKIAQKLTSSDTGMFMAQEWKRLISPFTPRRTGTMEDTAKVSPFTIFYSQPYSAYVYYGNDLTFRRDANPYATHHWDLAAEQSGQAEKLARAIENYLNRRDK